MWNPIEYVAKSRNLDATELKRFALDNKDKYGIVKENDSVEVNTWYVDKLITDFRAAQNSVAATTPPSEP